MVLNVHAFLGSLEFSVISPGRASGGALLLHFFCAASVFCLTSSVFSQEEPSIEARVESLATDWSETLDATPAANGKVTIEQTLTRVDPVGTPIADQRHDAHSIEEFETAEVVFLVDFQKNKTRCRWSPVGKKIEVGVGEVMVANVDDNLGESESILTESDFFHHPLGSWVSGISGGPLQDELTKLDREHRVSVENGRRRLVFRDVSSNGRAFSERSFVFLPDRLFQIGGQRFDRYLRSVAANLATGKATCEQFIGEDNASVYLRMKTSYRRTKDSPPDLEVETIWKKRVSRQAVPIPAFVPTMAILSICGGPKSFDAPNHYQTVWHWPLEELNSTQVVPDGWTFNVSAEAAAQSSFRREVTVNQWEAMAGVMESEFKPTALHVFPGDLILDRESGSVSYVGEDNSQVNIGKVVARGMEKTSSAEGASRKYLFWAGLIVLALTGVSAARKILR